MSRSTTPLALLDLSRLPPPTLVAVDYEAQLAERLSGLTERMTAAGIPWDVGSLETDPAVIIEQADNYRELLVRQAINDAALRRTLGFARGADLDWIAATFFASLGIRRMDGESDARLERRLLLAPGAYAGAQSAAGIVFLALSADVRVIDARAIKRGAGDMECVVLAEPADETAAVEAVRAVLMRSSVRPGTVPIAVRAAVPVNVTATLRLVVRPGPDPALVRLEALSMVDRLTFEARSTIGRAVSVDELKVRAWVGDVVRVHVDAPAEDVEPGEDGVVRITTTITTEVAS
jgi:phage-related baseplate assembly protein